MPPVEPIETVAPTDDAARIGAAPRRRRRWPKRLALAVAVVIALACAGFALYVSDYYHAASTNELLSGENELSVVETNSYIAIGESGTATGEAAADKGFVLYPGAKVDPHAYVPLAEDLAERGILCVIVKSPFNLAFFDMDAAQAIVENYPNVGAWWVGGHSLGGVVAAQFASAHADELKGVALLASYSAADLSETGLRVLCVYGTEDGVLNMDSMEKNAANLPGHAGTIALEGGNHAGFGVYGPQAGDGEATISADAQQEQTADLIAALTEWEGDDPFCMEEPAVPLEGMGGEGFELAENAA